MQDIHALSIKACMPLKKWLSVFRETWFTFEKY